MESCKVYVRVKNSYQRIKPVYSKKAFPNSVKFYYYGWRKDGIGYVDRKSIRKGEMLIDVNKVLVPAAWGSGDPKTDWLQPFVADMNSCATETYLVVGPFKDVATCNNVISYIQTKFFHFMIAMIKLTHHGMQKVYSLAPMQDFSKPWTDEELYAKYSLTDDEIAFIENMIRPME